MGGMVTIFDPQGNRGEIPQEQLAAAVKAGATPGVQITDPSGNLGDIPADRTHEAVANGAKIVPFKQQEVKHPGFWSTLHDSASEKLHAIVPDSLEKLKSIPSAAAILTMNPADAAAMMMQQARKSGVGQSDQSALYRTAAPAAQSLGLDVPGQEKSAAEGDVGGVLAHATTAAAPYVAGEVISNVPVPEGAASALRKPAAALLKGASDVVDPEVTGVVSPRLAHAQRLAGRLADALQKKPEEFLDATGENKPYAGETEPPEGPAAKKELPEAFQGPGHTYQPPVGTATNPFKSIADAPPAKVLQAVDELSPQATQQQVLDKVNELSKPAKLDDFVDRIKQQEAAKAKTRGKAIWSTDEDKLSDMNPMTESLWNEGVSGERRAAPRIDTDALSQAYTQARTELEQKLGKENVTTLMVSKRAQEIAGIKPQGDIGEVSRQKNPEPTAAETGRGQSITEEPVEPPKRTPIPNSPHIRVQQEPLTPEDVSETADIRDKIRNAADAEDAARLREIKGEYKMRNDPTNLKGNQTGKDQFLRDFAAETRNNVSINRKTGSEVSSPDFTELTKDIANPQQAARQLENLNKAGASKNAVNDFEMRASRKFGENWKHLAEQHDNLEGMVRESLKPENIAKFRAKAPKKSQP